jgi:hypothetical protein
MLHNFLTAFKLPASTFLDHKEPISVDARLDYSYPIGSSSARASRQQMWLMPPSPQGCTFGGVIILCTSDNLALKQFKIKKHNQAIYRKIAHRFAQDLGTLTAPANH